MGVARFVSEAGSVYRTRISALASSASAALELEFLAIVEMFRFAERTGTVSCADPDPTARSPDPSS